jgi:type IV secretion system protein VirB10
MYNIPPSQDKGGLHNGFRPSVKTTGISRNVKLALFVLGGAAVLGLMYGIMNGGVHHGGHEQSAKAPGFGGPRAATAPSLVVPSTGATNSTSATASTSSGNHVPQIPGVSSKKVMAKLQKIEIGGMENRAKMLEQAKSTLLQARLSASQSAYNATSAFPNMTAKTGAKPEQVANQRPNPATSAVEVPTPTDPAYKSLESELAGLKGSKGYGQANMQGQKSDFLARAGKQKDNDYLHQIVKAPLSGYELQAGEVIPAILIAGVNSDLPGEVTGQVSQNVYSNINGTLIIPQGSRLVGIYSSNVSYGQTRVQVAWLRVIYPDGNSINIDGMVGSSRSGLAGFHDIVDNHFLTIFGSALMYSMLGAGAELAQPQQSTQYGGAPTVGQTIGSAVGTQIVSTGQTIVSRDLNIQPTLKIPAGYQFVVMVNKDMVFPGPYKGHN